MTGGSRNKSPATLWALLSGVGAGVILAAMSRSVALFPLGFVGGALAGFLQYRVWRAPYDESARGWPEASSDTRNRQRTTRVKVLMRASWALAAVVSLLLLLLWIIDDTPGPQAVLLFAPSVVLLGAALHTKRRSGEGS
jgi:hypothetical protein